MPEAVKTGTKKRTADAHAKKTADTPGGKNTTSTAMQLEQKARRTKYIIIGLISAVVLAIIGVLYYQGYVEPYQRVVITVDNTKLRMDYFLDRTRLAGADPIEMTQDLTDEILIQQGAPRYGISVTPQDVDAVLRQAATGNAKSISDAAFQEWYRQQLSQARVPDAMFRQIISNGILAARLQNYLAAKMPTIVPQVRVSWIQVPTEDEANKVIARWKAGESFAKLAGEVSQDKASAAKGGDLGWMPNADSGIPANAFSLQVNKISDAYPYLDNPSDPNAQPSFYYILLVTDKSNARQVDPQNMDAYKSQALGNWLKQEMPKHKISWNFDSSMYAWIKNQLATTQPVSILSGGNQSAGNQSAGNQSTGGQPSGGQPSGGPQ